MKEGKKQSDIETYTANGVSFTMVRVDILWQGVK